MSPYKFLRQTLLDLLYGDDEDEKRITRIIKESNGFGLNIVTGLLHAVYPERHILYNRRSVDMLTALGFDWPNNWRQNAAAYLVYRDLMQMMRAEFDFVSLTDVDWFVYGWGGWQIVEEIPAAPEPEVSKETTTRPKFEVTKTGQLPASDLVSVGPLFEETPASEEPESPATGYFIFQQKPESEYDDQTGVVYNWRQGIPNYKQVQPGARFIYYRPGEKVFFGCGRIEWIETRQDEDARTIYDGQISDYEQWKPVLPLTKSLANELSFVRPERLGVGQAGIRKISAQDFVSILKAYRHLLYPGDAVDVNDVDSSRALGEEEPILHEDEFAHMKDLIRTNLKGEKIYTPSGKANIIRDITNTGLLGSI